MNGNRRIRDIEMKGERESIIAHVQQELQELKDDLRVQMSTLKERVKQLEKR